MYVHPGFPETILGLTPHDHRLGRRGKENVLENVLEFCKICVLEIFLGEWEACYSFFMHCRCHFVYITGFKSILRQLNLQSASKPKAHRFLKILFIAVASLHNVLFCTGIRIVVYVNLKHH
jgi:hypothetical protein